jgi:phosphoribosylaminoimidazole-succinocarboxamide synthase
VELPPGLKRASKLPQPIFTPATKAEAGHHDENITFERMSAMIGAERAREVRDTAIALYRAAADYALSRGIIIADTKFEFGVDEHGKLALIDEALTPDSSRFWPLDTWREGASPESFDKQYVRNWLDSIGFERKPPAPAMPPEVARRTSEKYQEALKRLTA